MSQDMNRLSGSGYNYYIPGRSKLGALKGFIASTSGYPAATRDASSQNPDDPGRLGWRAWAGEKARKLSNGGWRSPGSNDPQDSIEKLHLFPGWAVRRGRIPKEGEDASLQPFELEVFISGYAISFKNRESMSRAQRAFIRVAKGFAALPRIASEPLLVAAEPPPLSRSTEELLSHIHLPPRPEEVSDTYDTDALDRQFRRAQLQSDGRSLYPSSAASSSADIGAALEEADERIGQGQSTPSLPDSLIRQMHANLEARLQPFWSSVLPNRTVRISLFASPHIDDPSKGLPQDEELRPITSVEAITQADGSFQAQIVIQYEQLCHHPTSLHIAFGRELTEHYLLASAELQKAQPLYVMTGETPQYAQYHSSRRPAQDLSEPTTTSTVTIPISHSPIRVISDIDDTVKDSGVLNGARAVFHNVFVKDLKDCVVEGMGEWYTEMYKQGIRFHYVSNGPFEYLSVLNEFFPLSGLPNGSIKLRSFAGRSLFNGFFSAPMERKRAGVEDIIKAFPDARFFLIGDSGEQDLELYSELASAYPEKVLGVFIRDVSTKEGVTDPLDDPTGWTALAIQDSMPTSEGGVDASAAASSSSVSTRSRKSVTELLVDVGRRGSSSISSYLSGGKRSIDLREVREEGSYATANQNVPLTQEPESYERTPVAPALEPSETIRAGMAGGLSEQLGTLNVSPQRPVISQPPAPKSPPRIQSHRPSYSINYPGPMSYDISSRPSSRSQQSGDTSSVSDDGTSAGKVSVASGLQLPTTGVSPEEKRRNELQMRVWRARTIMPSHVKLRVFRHPRECLEAREIVERELGTQTPPVT